MSDQYFDQVVLLMHMDGVNGSVRFRDERHHFAAIVAGQAQLSTAFKKFGATSLVLDGTGDYLQVAGTDFAFGLGDFTIEGWLRTSVSKTQVIVDNFVNGGSGWQVLLTAAGLLQFYGSTSAVATGTTNIADGNWHHFAVTRFGATVRLFADGNLEATATYGPSLGQAASYLGIGAQVYSRNAIYDFSGNLDELRITKWVARYTAAFTPPAAAFPDYGPAGIPTDQHYDKVVLHCHFDGEDNATTFTDQKGHALSRYGSSAINTTQGVKFGGGSGFAATSSGIGCVHADMNLGAGDFTIEGFHATSGSSSNGPFLTMLDAAGTGAGLRIVKSATGSSGTLIVNGATITSALSFATTDVTTIMTHFAICREGSKLSGYSAGQRRWQYDIGTAAISSNGSIWFGAEGVLLNTGGSGIPQYFDEIRVTKGLARYSKDATTYAVPTEPFPDYAVQKLTGTVRDSAGNPLARVVRSYRRSDGLLVDSATSDAATGAFSLRATDTTPHFVVVHDDVKNALVFDHVVPVI